jgi:fucose 4-O-acetylase-like acetyltransferase
LIKRQPGIDVLKGIGIVAVVVGHITYNRALVAQIFMFHMPLFFLVGGWLHDAATPQRAYLKAKALSLLVPYACFLAILWPLELMLAVPDGAAGGRWTWPLLVEPMLFGGGLLTGFAGVLWFVTCYFLTQQLAHFLLRRYRLPVCAALACAMLAGAWLLPPWPLPWGAQVVLFSAPLYLAGYAARGIDLTRWAPLWLLLTLGALLLNAAGAANTFDLKSGNYGLPVVTLASALAAVALLAVLALRIHASMAGRMLAALGGASMTIMFLHQFVQLAMAKKLGVTQAAPRIACALLVCYLAHLLLAASPLAARLFLGRRPGRVAPRVTP